MKGSHFEMCLFIYLFYTGKVTLLKDYKEHLQIIMKCQFLFFYSFYFCLKCRGLKAYSYFTKNGSISNCAIPWLINTYLLERALPFAASFLKACDILLSWKNTASTVQYQSHEEKKKKLKTAHTHTHTEIHKT